MKRISFFPEIFYVVWGLLATIFYVADNHIYACGSELSQMQKVMRIKTAQTGKINDKKSEKNLNLIQVQ